MMDEVPRSAGGDSQPQPAPAPSCARTFLRSWGVALLGLALVAAAGWWVANSSLFHLRTLQVSGNEHVSAAEVARLGALTEQTNVLLLSPGRLERSLERNPWILSADISRTLPSVISISIEERVPVAILGQERWLVAGDGTVLGPAGSSDRLPEILAEAGDLQPGVKLPTSRSELAALESLPSSLLRRVASAGWASGQLTLILRSGTTVLYGDATMAGEKARSLQSVLAWAARKGIYPAYVDVRAPSAPALMPAAYALSP